MKRIVILLSLLMAASMSQAQIGGAIGKKLKELRKSAGLTQEQLASKLGLSRVNYTRYEVGAVRPDYETIILLADFYDISLDELFGRN